MNHAGRLRRLRKNLDRDFGALLINHLPNIRYLCGFTGSSAALIVTPRKSLLFTDGRYTAQARAEVQGARVVISGKGAMAAAGEWIASHRSDLGRSAVIGIEGEHLTVSSHGHFKKLMPAGFRLKNAPDFAQQARMLK